MKIKRIVFFSIILISLFSCSSSENNSSADIQPNIIFILVDDLGWGDLGCYGHPYAETPNIDKLAEGGILFKKFYTSGVSCCPSRTAFMTGKHPASFKDYMADYGFGNNITITELLQEAGYATAHTGKWHMGPIEDMQKLPYGIDFSNYNKLEKDTLKGRDTHSFDWAIDFIKNKSHHPFYINIWTHIVHVPLRPRKEMLRHFEDIEVDKDQFGKWFNQDKLQVLKKEGRSINEAMKMYLAELYNLDMNIGNLVQCLEEQNLDENTIIIFSSDHGPAPVRVAKEQNGEKDQMRLNMLGYAGGLRGGKHTLYEGGVRVPFIVKWPKKIKKNQIDNKSVVSSLDLLPTICSISGIKYEKNSFHGEDKSQVWYGNPEARMKPLYWKREKNNSISILENQWKLYKGKKGRVTLYNIELDPYEENEISSQETQVVERLLEQIDEWTGTLPQ